MVAGPQGTSETSLPPVLVLFDGTCGLCHHAVRWLLQRDTARRLMFAPLQGTTAARVRKRFAELPAEVTAVAAVIDDALWLGAPAVLAVLRHLPPPWSHAAALRHLPGWLSDGVYRLVARLRYRLFGRFDHCEMPTRADRARFLP